MTAASKALVEIVVDARLEEKARQIVDFARFLQRQFGDSEWERIIDAARSRSKLDAFVEAALHEGSDEHLDRSKL